MHSTLHVFSWTVFGAGVTMTYLDANTLPEFRRELRKRGFAITKDPGEGGGEGGNGSGTGDEIEEALQEWVVNTFAEKRVKGEFERRVRERVSEMEMERERERNGEGSQK